MCVFFRIRTLLTFFFVFFSLETAPGLGYGLERPISLWGVFFLNWNVSNVLFRFSSLGISQLGLIPSRVEFPVD
jgi:hypothetical protein